MKGIAWGGGLEVTGPDDALKTPRIAFNARRRG
jgi:hypothetical protein